ncbi:MAG: MerR family DNA-binding protein [Psychrobium sp.]|nr:MerR family DNA-binding protein [Psychrobium sp.]
MNKKTLTIGRLAKAAAVNIETIRHYQRVGLINEPVKPLSGFRHYSIELVERLRFIKSAQQLGFSLQEIQQLLCLGNEHCSDIKILAEEKRHRIEQQIKGLLTIQSVLDDMINSCQDDNKAHHCAFIDALSKKKALK